MWVSTPIRSEAPFCDSQKVYTTKGRSTKPSKKDIPEYRCANKECGKKFSVTKGTIFEATKIPLRTWFAAMFLITNHKKGISSHQLQRDLQITQKTAWFVLHRIHEMYKESASELLKNVVEIDETFIGGKYKNKHADKKKPGAQGSIDKTVVFGAVQRHGKVKAFVVPDRTNKTVISAMVANVQRGSLMVSDEYYHRDTFNLHGYNLVVMEHKVGEYVRGAFHTNTIEGFWSLLKRGIYGIYHNVSPKHLQRYCDEFSYRYNTREQKQNERFTVTLQNAGKHRLRYKDLIKKDDTEAGK
jgi:transposase-like protein